METAVAARPGQVENTFNIDPALTSTSRTMKDGALIEIRPVRSDDEQRMITFHRGLSERSVYMRYFKSPSLAARTTHTRLAQICFADSNRHIVLVALYLDAQSGEQKIVAVGRLNRLVDPSYAELALLVVDEFQKSGLGTELLRQLIQAAHDQKITRIEAEMLRDNTTIQRVLKKFGFHLQLADPRSVRAVLNR
jgi:acetyltransferase